MRLNRYLAMCGVAARRKADELIAAGRVTVNGDRPPPGGILVRPGEDRVEVDGAPVAPAADHVYFMVNKPAGYLSAVSDRTRRPLVTQLVPRATRPGGLHPVGRLDLRSRGLVILTDDGELSYRLQHPRHHVEKEYIVEIAGRIDAGSVGKLRSGIPLEEGVTAPADVELLRDDDQRSVLRVVLRQGWKRQLRRSFSALGRVVVDLRRVRIGSLLLGDLEEGQARSIGADELRALQVAVGLARASAGLVVTIDGPSASGKSTVGRMLARHLDLPLVDTGLMYRAVTVLAQDAGVDPADEEALGRIAEDAEIEVNTTTDDGPHWEVRAAGRDLTGRVFEAALAPALTRVSQARRVREALVERQRRYRSDGVVMVGRDIGTVVFPDADLKLFITASDEQRRQRRTRQMSEADRGLIKGEISDRDAADSGRTISPLRAADDAYTIDTDDRSPDQVFAEVLRLIPEPHG